MSRVIQDHYPHTITLFRKPQIRLTNPGSIGRKDTCMPGPQRGLSERERIDRRYQHVTIGMSSGVSGVKHRSSARHMMSAWVLGLAVFVAVPSWAQQGAAAPAPATPPSGERKPTQQPLQMLGEVLAVDQAARTLRVRLEDGGEQTVQVDQKAMIYVKARLRSLSDVQPPQWVHIGYVEQEGRRIATSIVGVHPKRPATPTAHGKVVAVDLKAQMLKIRTQDGKEQTFRIGGETHVSLVGRRQDLNELKTGRQVMIEFTEQDGERLAGTIVITPPGPSVRRLPPTPDEPTP